MWLGCGAECVATSGTECVAECVVKLVAERVCCKVSWLKIQIDTKLSRSNRYWADFWEIWHCARHTLSESQCHVCSVLQCVTVCSLPCARMHTLHISAVWCSVMQCVAVWCSVLQCVVVCSLHCARHAHSSYQCSVLQCVAVCSVPCARHTPF